MTLDPDLIAKIVAPLISLVGAAVLKHYTESKSRLVSYIGSVAAFARGTEPKIHTHTVVLLNAGKKSAFNVCVPHGVPMNLLNVQVGQNVHFTTETNPAGNFSLLFPSLAPREQITISYLYQEPLVWSQISGHPKSDDGLADIVHAIPAPRPNRALIWGTFALAFIGLSVLIFLALRALLQSAA